MIGVSHHTAPVEVRERVAFTPSEIPGALAELQPDRALSEAVLLSTCNRTELYLHPVVEADVLASARRLLEVRAGPLPRPLSEHLYEWHGDAAVRHLFRVTSGLDAMVVGEAEIQGQVRAAYQLSARGEGPGIAVGPVLHRLFQMALAAGGRVRAETSLGEGTASVAYAAVQLARKIFGSLAGRRVLILGAGDTSELVVDALAREGVSGVVVANRTYERAETLARRLEGRAVRMAQIAEHLAAADVVVASTAAPHPVLTREGLTEAFPTGPDRPVLMIDLAIPRDIEPSLGDEPNLFLYNVDDLRQIVDANMAQRRQAVPDAERIVDDMTGRFRAWYAGQEAVPLIRSLRDRADRIRVAEVSALLAGMADLSVSQRASLEDFSRRLLNKLLHDPTVRLKTGAAGPDGEALIQAARFLYGLDQGPSDPDLESPPTGEISEEDDDL